MKFRGSIKRNIAIVAALYLVGCSNAALYKGQLNAQSTASMNFCTTPAANVITNLKYIFVFDHSGSNTQNYIPDGLSPYTFMDLTYTGGFVQDPLGGTDLFGEKRFGSLIRFLQGITDTPNTYYASIDFSDSPQLNPALQWVIGGVRTPLTTAISVLGSECTNNAQNPDPNCTGTPNDGGNTDYEDTLADQTQSTNTNTIYGLVYNDVLNAEQQQILGNAVNASDYVIFWVSDGAPYVQVGGIPTLQSEVAILGEVDSIVNLQTLYPDFVDSITLNTGFYHLDHSAPTCPITICPGIISQQSWTDAELQDETAAQYMSDMALHGRGQFVDFSSNVIDYTKFNVPARIAKFVLRDFWVQDSSTVWWNGTLMLDTDQDGIPDVIETQMGSNPLAYDSDGNGLGDGVELRVYGTPCGDSKCQANGNMRQPAGPAKQANKCMYRVAPNAYGDADCDFLNDYEESILSSNMNDYDSNQDWVPDQFEFASLVSYVAGTNSLNADPENDGITDYFKMKENLPVNFPANQIHGISPMTYTLTQVSDNPSQTCFQVSVQNLATMSTRDVIRAYIMESRGAVGSSRKMRVAQKVTNGQVSFSDSDFSP